MKRRGFLSSTLLVLVALVACVSPTGGWDSASFVALHPEIAEIRGQRIGDLTPYPAIVDGQVAMVTCRFVAEGRPIPIAVSGEGWPATWGERALEAVDAAVSAVEFDRRSLPLDSPGIHIRSLAAAGGTGPAGLADTRAECDVGAEPSGETDVRGRLVHAEVRIRRRVLGTWALERAATAEGWVGAMLHELGHALGFQGHAAVGDSLVQLEQSRLRALGRRVLAGGSVPAPNVRALYAVAPGTRLGVATLSASAEAVVAAAVREISARTSTSGPPIASRSVVGDRHARLAWRWRDGTSLVLRFPNWSESLRWGRPVEVRRGEVGAREARQAYSETSGSIARARATSSFARFVSPAARSTRPSR